MKAVCALITIALTLSACAREGGSSPAAAEPVTIQSTLSTDGQSHAAPLATGSGEFQFDPVVSDEYVTSKAEAEPVVVGGPGETSSCLFTKSPKGKFSISMTYDKTGDQASVISTESTDSSLLTALDALSQQKAQASAVFKNLSATSELSIMEYGRHQTQAACTLTADAAKLKTADGGSQSGFRFDIDCPETTTKPVGGSKIKSYSRGRVRAYFYCAITVAK